RKHPIKMWIKRAKTIASTKEKIKHISNLENIATEFPFAMDNIQENNPFKQAPWDPGPQQTTASANRKTKEKQRAEIRKLAKTKWTEQWNKGGLDGASKTTAAHLRRILRNNEPTQGPELYKTIKSRQSCATLAQLRTGHCGLNYYLARFKKADNPKCPH